MFPGRTWGKRAGVVADLEPSAIGSTSHITANILIQQHFLLTNGQRTVIGGKRPTARQQR
jgi:hypothetical protein